MPDASTRPGEILIVGAGPAGLTAATLLLQSGRPCTLVDQSPAVGGRVDAGRGATPSPAAARAWAPLQAHRDSGLLRLHLGCRAVGAVDQSLLVEPLAGGPALRLRWATLLLAGGAQEVVLPFPGWTLPGVQPAGGLQLMLKAGLDLRGRKLVLAGSGPLLLVAAASALRAGAQQVTLVERAPRTALARFAAQLPRWPQRLRAALSLTATLTPALAAKFAAMAGSTFASTFQSTFRSTFPGGTAGGPASQPVPPAGRLRWLLGAQVLRATGDGTVRSVEVQARDGSVRSLPCDHLGVSDALRPELALADLLGCRRTQRHGGAAVAVDAYGHSSVPGVYAIGESCGVGGRDKAVAEARACALHLTGDVSGARRAAACAAHEARFATLLAQTFPLPADPAARLSDDTLVCRCEDVSWAALRHSPDARSARLHERCGMGWCQGRSCGIALQLLRGFGDCAEAAADTRADASAEISADAYADALADAHADALANAHAEIPADTSADASADTSAETSFATPFATAGARSRLPALPCRLSTLALLITPPESP